MWGGHHKGWVRWAGPTLSRGKHPGWKARGSTQRTSPAGKSPGLSETRFLSGQEGHSEPVAPWQTGAGPLSMKQNPSWMNGCLGGGPVHCQRLVLSGKRSQYVKKKGTGGKEAWEKGLEWNLPQRALSLVVEARLMLYLSTKGAWLSPAVQNEAGSFPRRGRECFQRFQVSWRRSNLRLRSGRMADGNGQRSLGNRANLLPSALSAWSYLLKAWAMAPSDFLHSTWGEGRRTVFYSNIVETRLWGTTHAVLASTSLCRNHH